MLYNRYHGHQGYRREGRGWEEGRGASDGRAPWHYGLAAHSQQGGRGRGRGVGVGKGERGRREETYVTTHECEVRSAAAAAVLGCVVPASLERPS